MMKGSVDRCGYIKIIIHGKNVLVHRIIASVFILNPNNLEQVNHKNGIKTDNNVDNLEWCTRSENLIHAYKIGLEKKQTGESHHAHKLTNDNVKYIKTHYIKRDPIYGATALGKKFNVNRTTIVNVYKGKTWKEVV